MSSQKNFPGPHAPHTPENAEHEIRKAYNCLIEAETALQNTKKLPPWIQRINTDLQRIYKEAFRAFRNDERLLAERRARTAKHLARGVWHETKIAYLEAETPHFPYLDGATAEEYNLHEHSDTTEDLLNSVAQHIPSGQSSDIVLMHSYLETARKHLKQLCEHPNLSELIRAEHIKAAYEYGRVLECMQLALEVQSAKRKAA